MKREVHIREFRKGWRIDGSSHMFQNAASALKSVKRKDKKLCPDDGIVITAIHWHTRTPIGAMVVRALAGEA